MKNVPLFDAPPAPELKLSKALVKHKLAKGEKVTYAGYRVTRTHVQCVECVWVLHEAGGKGWSINGATVSRKDESGERLLLCNPHAQLWRRLDGVGEKRAKSQARGRR